MDVTVMRSDCALPALQKVDTRLGIQYQDLFVAQHDLEDLRDMTRKLLPGVLRQSMPKPGGKEV